MTRDHVVSKSDIGRRVSVVIPAFNSIATIRRALDSCLRQTLPPFEIVVVDDASGDETSEVAEGLLRSRAKDCDVRYQVIRHKINSGPAKTRNDGWNVSEGDWVAFLDADDVWHPHKLDFCLRALIAHPDAVLMGHAFRVFDSPEEWETWELPSGNASAPRRIPFLSLLLYNRIPTPTALVARHLPERFDEHMRHCEDHELWVRIAASHEVMYLDVPLARLGRPSLSRGGTSAAIGRMRLGEIRMYFRLPRLGKALFLLVPFLLVWSIAKHCGVCLFLWTRGTVPCLDWRR